MGDVYMKMVRISQDYVLLVLLIVIVSLFNLSCCQSQSDSPRNIETYYPFPYPSSPPHPPAPASPPDSVPTVPPSRSISSKRAIITAVAATAASVFVLASVLIVLIVFFKNRRRNRPPQPAVAEGRTMSESKKIDGNAKGYVVDDDGLDVVYWKKLKTHAGGLPRGRSSSSHSRLPPVDDRFSFQSPVDDSTPKQSALAVPTPKKKGAMPPPPPPSPWKKKAAPPPPGKRQELAGAGEGGSDQVKLKALHWEKVNISHERSNVWDQIEGGSFQYNGDMMEALFGVAATKRKPSLEENSTGEASTRIFILDQRKSQNIAIVIKSLGIPHTDLIKALLDGKGQSPETLEKLTRMAPTREEVSSILAFTGDPANLAYAEYFLYGLLKAVPSAFTRANEMLFKFTYHYETLGLKESFKALESACEELRSRGTFLKLLEAILKAGNRLNAGTSRGDAKAFNLTTLRKLSDYKSTDGKTTLLHFVVHEVVRNEGRKCALTRSNSAGRQSPGSDDDPSANEEQEEEYIRLGLPVVGGLSSEFSDVKKAANIDYDALKGTLGSLANRVREAMRVVANEGGGGGFVKEMTYFLASAEMEMKEIQQEHDRVMEVVNKTTHYYQAKGSNDRNPIQLFVIVKDFLSMVDLACVEIARSVQQKKQPKAESGSGSGSGSGSSHSDVLKSRFTFPRLPENFMSDKSSSSSGDDS